MLVATTMVAGSSLTALAGVAYATTSTVAISASSSTVNVGDASFITVTTTANQALTIFASGSALFAADPANNAAGTASISTTCPIGQSPCTLPALTDATSEAIVVTATGDTDFQSATTTVNVTGLHFANCPQTDVNSGNSGTAAQLCSTQTTVGKTKTATVAYVRNGIGVDNVSVIFTLLGSSDAVFATTQPAGSAYYSPTQINCITAAGGLCKVNYLDNAVENISVVASGPHAIAATLSVDVLASAIPGSLERTYGSTVVSPDGSIVERPGVALQNTYTLRSTCTPTSATVTCEGDRLAGVPVALTVDHGFFTPNCTVLMTTNYANCTFATTPVAGAVVGNLKHLTGPQTYVTDANGEIVVTLAIARDAAFDAAGYVDTTVSGVAAGSSAVLSEIFAPNGTAPTCTAATVNTAGCPSISEWTTDNTPLNGGGVFLKAVDGSTLTGTPNNVLNSTTPTFVVQTTDQFGNLSSNGGTPLTLAGTGTPDLVQCYNYTSSAACPNQNVSGSLSFDVNRVATRTYAGLDSNFNDATDVNGNLVQSRFAATLNPQRSNSSATSGTQADVATWTAPVTTFAGFVASTTTAPARAGFTDTVTAAQTATADFNFYEPTAGNITFAVTPTSSVPVNTVVTASATVLDQFGQALPNTSVQFFRSGDGTCSSAQSSGASTGGGIATNDAGKAGFSFYCQTAGSQTVTMIVLDASGNELGRGQKTITFVAPTPAPVVDPSIDGASQRKVVKNHGATITGLGAAGTTVYLHFHKAGTAANDYSIVRPVLIKADGTWTRTFLASTDYRVFVSNSDSATQTAASYLVLAR